MSTGLSRPRSVCAGALEILSCCDPGESTRATVDDHDAFVLKVELEQAKKRGRGKSN